MSDAALNEAAGWLHRLQQSFFQAQHLGIVGFARAGGVDGNVHADLAVTEHKDAVGEHGGFDHVVGDQNDGKAFPAPEVGLCGRRPQAGG